MLPRLFCFSDRGFSFTELSIGLLLAGILSVGAYQVTFKIQRGTANTLQKSRTDRETEKFLQRLSLELANIVSIPGGASTLAAAKAPDSYVDCGIDGAGPSKGKTIANGLIPLPGRNVSDFPSGLGAIDPSIPLGSNETKSDSIRIVFLSQDSEPIFLQEGVSVTGSQGIVLQQVSGLKAGDFALVSNEIETDLFRVTSTNELGNGSESLSHDGTSSWNQSFSSCYGSGCCTDCLRGYVQKVSVADYSYSPEIRAIVRDTHQSDDGFNQTNQTFDSPGRVFNWTPIATNIEDLKVVYEVKTDSNALSSFSTRTPRIGLQDDSFPCSQNQLGYPNLSRVRFEISQRLNTKDGDEVRISRTMNPENLRRGKSGGVGLSLESEPVSILPIEQEEVGSVDPPLNPTSTPTPSGPPAPSGGGN